MKIFKSQFLILLISCCYSLGYGQYIQVDDTYTAQQLVQNVLLNSGCANATNFTFSGDPFSSGAQSFGYFNAGTSSFPFSEGIVMSTCRARRTEGPNNNLIDEGQVAWQGDTDLEQALNITGTFNATIIEFDFTPLTSAISFDYIFASEEYQGTAPCRYSDGFAFLLKEANSNEPYKNLALIPNTDTPVLVTTVHPDIPGRCPAINEMYFGGYNGINAPINFNGQTVVLTARSNVIAGRTYHIKLVIADHENIRYDSAIFLRGGSFDVGTNLGPDRLIATQNPICNGTPFTIQTTESGSNTYKWFVNGSEIPGETNSNLVVNAPGNYAVEITLGSTTCVARGEITIEYVPNPSLVNTTALQCDEDSDGTTIFNLTRLSSIITGNDPNYGLVSFYENIADAQVGNIAAAITNPGSYTSTPRTIYASAQSSFGCNGVATITLQISGVSFPLVLDYESCDLDGDIDGFYAFDLNDIDSLVLNGLPSGLLVRYFPTFQDALLETNVLLSPAVNQTQFISRIYAKIINGSDCYGIRAVDLYVNSNTPPNFGDEEVFLCDDIPLPIAIATNFFSYNWSNGDTDFSTDLAAPGEYTVTVTNRDGCEATKTFTAIASGAPTITSVDIDDFQGEANTVTINVSGIGTWEYSLDGVNFQTSPTFVNVLPGEYEIVVRDQNLCGSDFEDIIVLNYPTFFTPNDDTYNDVWNIENLNFYPTASIKIFDRYGKLLKEASPKNGWDGTYLGRKLPSDDYWFVLELGNGRIIRGHFSLKG